MSPGGAGEAVAQQDNRAGAGVALRPPSPAPLRSPPLRGRASAAGLEGPLGSRVPGLVSGHYGPGYTWGRRWEDDAVGPGSHRVGGSIA